MVTAQPLLAQRPGLSPRGCVPGICHGHPLHDSTRITTDGLASVTMSPPSLQQTAGGTGLFPGLPSPTPSGLGLGPD
jgi:hypothetical protein